VCVGTRVNGFEDLNGEKFLSFRVFFHDFCFQLLPFRVLTQAPYYFLHVHSSRYSFIVVVSTMRLWRVNKERYSQEVLFGTVARTVPQTPLL
jgi:hypothetical protein